MNKDRICEVIVSYCGQCPNHYYYNDEEWICKKTFEHLENLEEFGKECPLKEEEQMLDEESETIDNSYLIFQNKKLKERVSYLEEQVSKLKYFQRGDDNNIIRLFDKIDNLEKKLELLCSPCEDEDGESV